MATILWRRAWGRAAQKTVSVSVKMVDPEPMPAHVVIVCNAATVANVSAPSLSEALKLAIQQLPTEERERLVLWIAQGMPTPTKKPREKNLDLPTLHPAGQSNHNVDRASPSPFTKQASMNHQRNPLSGLSPRRIQLARIAVGWRGGPAGGCAQK
jgi:hypothetical protein